MEICIMAYIVGKSCRRRSEWYINSNSWCGGTVSCGSYLRRLLLLRLLVAANGSGLSPFLICCFGRVDHDQISASVMRLVVAGVTAHIATATAVVLDRSRGHRGIHQIGETCVRLANLASLSLGWRGGIGLIYLLFCGTVVAREGKVFDV